MVNLFESRIKDLSNDVSQGVLRELGGEHVLEREAKNIIQTRNLYLPRQICNTFGIDDKAVESVLQGVVNHEEKRRVLYGHLSASTLPKEFTSAVKDVFGDWGLISFYRGRWDIKNPDLGEPLEKISIRHICRGSESLRRHFRKGLVEEFDKRQFISVLDRIRNTYNEMIKPGIETNFLGPGNGPYNCPYH